ncbi:hypothetical protein PS663_02241 [Pseudomonas fluorescens]|nr:hypothetical protein PS663_02241 [Pseudomonas fluorescens]
MPPPQSLTVVIRQPEDPRTCQLILEQVRYVVWLYGGRVTSIEQGDAIAMRLKLADRLASHEISQVSRELDEQLPLKTP